MAKKKVKDTRELEITELGEVSETTIETEEEKWRKFLAPSKIIRDAVHGDIWLTDTEVNILATPLFQRLRYIRQLGSCHLIYPSANHTRFEHSIGVLHLSQKILESVERNFEFQDRIVGDKFLDNLAQNDLHIREAVYQSIINSDTLS